MGISKFFRGDTLKYRPFLTDKASGTPISVDRGTLTFSMKRRQRDAVPVIEVIVESSEFNIFQPTGMIDLTETGGGHLVTSWKHWILDNRQREVRYWGDLHYKWISSMRMSEVSVWRSMA